MKSPEPTPESRASLCVYPGVLRLRCGRAVPSGNAGTAAPRSIEEFVRRGLCAEHGRLVEASLRDRAAVEYVARSLIRVREGF